MIKDNDDDDDQLIMFGNEMSSLQLIMEWCKGEQTKGRKLNL